MAKTNGLKLTPKLAEDFAMLKAQRKALEKEESTMATGIKTLMIEKDPEVVLSTSVGKNGEVKTYTYAPSKSPHMIEYLQYKAVDVSWQKEFEKLYVSIFGQEAYNDFCARLPLKDSDKLDAKTNPYHVSK